MARPAAAPFGGPSPDLIGRLGGLVPTGLFDNTGIESFLRSVFESRGRSNDFRELARKLYVVAVDLDSGEAVRFGSEGWDDVPISLAIQASAALPGLYPPVDIRGRHFVDGALRRTMHASVVMDHGIDLMLGINPLVPFNSGSSQRERPKPTAGSSRGGLPVVLSQTFRTLLQSRMQVGLAKYAQQYPATDQLVFEPNEDDGEMFFTNIFSYSSRQQRLRARLRQHARRPAPPARRRWRRCSRGTACACATRCSTTPPSPSPTASARAAPHRGQRAPRPRARRSWKCRAR